MTARAAGRRTASADGPLFASAARALASCTASSLEFAVLGSSSSGNASVLRVTTPAGRRQILIDAGLSPRAVRGAMSALGLDFDETNEVLFTHFDQDHAREGWARVASTTGLALRCARQHMPHALARGYPAQFIQAFESRGAGFDLGPVRVIPCENAHDDGGTVAFRLETPAGSVGYATDIGRVHAGLVETLRGVHLLAIESNYDRAMQLSSNRPAFLKQRIMGGKGHLSNEECVEAVRGIAWPDHPEHVVLLHLSRDCNAPEVVRGLWSRELPSLAPVLSIAAAGAPTPVIRMQVGRIST